MPSITVKYKRGRQNELEVLNLAKELTSETLHILDRAVGRTYLGREAGGKFALNAVVDVQRFHSEAQNAPDVEVVLVLDPGPGGVFSFRRREIRDELGNFVRSAFPADSQMTIDIDLRFMERCGKRIGPVRQELNSW